MQIILTKNEYVSLRPNVLRDTLIEEIKEIINTTDGWQAERALEDIKDKVRKYDRQLERQEADPHLLWGVDNAAPQD